jgi:DAK2 domain fusion protein YloV
LIVKKAPSISGQPWNRSGSPGRPENGRRQTRSERDSYYREDVLDSLDATAVRRWCAAGLDAMRRHQVEIDEINVYPVRDADTGTNLVVTITCAARALEADPDIITLGATLQCMARGAALHALGNSGGIVSQILRGLAEALIEVPAARGRALADALTAAAKAAYAAVPTPVEGTMLSVVHEAALAATAANSDVLAVVVEAAADGAVRALTRTTEQLPALAAAGVVDAGGQGLVVLLDSLVEVVTGVRPVRGALARPVPAPAAARETGSEQYGYEVQYLLDAPADAVEVLTSTLLALGDSLVVVDTGTGMDVGVWNVHIHVNDVGAAIEAGVRAGRPHRIAVTRFADQVAPMRVSVVDTESRGLVVLASGPGLARVFTAEGAVVVDASAAVPSTSDILRAVLATEANRVALLPNDVDALAAAQRAAEEARASGIRVGVVPTRSSVQAIAAIAVRDPGRRFHDDVIAMAEAAGACRYAEVTVAGTEALTLVGRVSPGDVLGLIEGDVNIIGTELEPTCTTLLDRMLAGGGEMVTLVLGAGAPAGLGDRLTEFVAERAPFADVRVYHGGQPHHPLLVGVE